MKRSARLQAEEAVARDGAQQEPGTFSHFAPSILHTVFPNCKLVNFVLTTLPNFSSCNPAETDGRHRAQHRKRNKPVPQPQRRQAIAAEKGRQRGEEGRRRVKCRGDDAEVQHAEAVSAHFLRVGVDDGGGSRFGLGLFTHSFPFDHDAQDAQVNLLNLHSCDGRAVRCGKSLGFAYLLSFRSYDAKFAFFAILAIR